VERATRDFHCKGEASPVVHVSTDLGVSPGRHKLHLAVRCIQSGGILAYPTEAVYGLGCDPWNGEAVRRLLAIKRRPEHKGLILIAADFVQLEPFVQPLDATRMQTVLATWPGPVTWLLPARGETPGWLTGRHGSLAVRVTAHRIAASLCRSAGSALVSTSANISDRPPAHTPLQVRLALGARVDLILAGRCGTRGRPSTIRDGRTGAVIRA
jgi:L-threonylcarbamoyladenylate synthase